MSIHLFSVLLAVGFIVLVLRHVRRGHLGAQYAILWLLLGVVMTVFALAGGHGLDRLAKVVGIAYAPSLLFLVGLIFSFGMILHLSVVVSQLREQVTRLTQEHALLAQEQGRRQGIS